MNNFLLLLIGLPGTGKSTIANALVKEFDNIVFLDTDQIRRKLFKHLYDADLQTWRVNIYDENYKEVVYNAITYFTETLLTYGMSVIVEGVFGRKYRRETVINVAKKQKKPYIVVWCETPQKILEARLKERQSQKTVSDANFNVYLKLKKNFEPITCSHVKISTDKPLNEIIKEIKTYVNATIHKEFTE